MSLIDRRRAYRLAGETLRDVGILVFVFGPLDALYEPGPPHEGEIATWLAGGLLLISVGIIMETWE